jgi:16S rRNA (guanine527-N7)-methyltransferase
MSADKRRRADSEGGYRRFRKEMQALGLPVSRETEAALQAMVTTLERWQRAINLISRATVDDIWTRHILDSAQLIPLISGEARSLTDLGSGAGLPGLVLAAFLPDFDITLVESDARKGAYLAEAARQMGVTGNLRVVIGRIEEVQPAKADIVTARALAPLGQLLALADRHRSDPAICLFHKGKGWRSELTEAHKDWEIEAQPFPSVTDRDAVLLRLAAYRAKDLRDR